mmetsp:Transcript_55230/g.115536  ORF Transcript_55230/g.115536 Transcript_55230/m.115536 type:complete len:203 (+) Transcript_55230:1576-2184(+)
MTSIRLRSRQNSGSKCKDLSHGGEVLHHPRDSQPSIDSAPVMRRDALRRIFPVRAAVVSNVEVARAIRDHDHVPVLEGVAALHGVEDATLERGIRVRLEQGLLQVAQEDRRGLFEPGVVIHGHGAQRRVGPAPLGVLARPPGQKRHQQVGLRRAPPREEGELPVPVPAHRRAAREELVVDPRRHRHRPIRVRDALESVAAGV